MKYFLVVFDVYMVDSPTMGFAVNTMLVNADSFEDAKLKIQEYYMAEHPYLEPKDFTNKTI